MKKSLFMLFLSIIFISIAIYIHFNQPRLAVIPAKFPMIAPLPSLLVHAYYSPSTSSDYWIPSFDKIETHLPTPALTAESALAYDLISDKFLYEKNPKKRLPIASLTKIMTAIVALENESSDTQITVSNSAANIGEDSMGISTGETFSLEELLYGMFLHSGNDAAEAIAQASKFERGNFVYLMNKKAEDLGLADTHFTNPTGLEGDGSQYSTAYDLLVMTRYGLQNPEFDKVSSTAEYDIQASSTHKEYDLFNETNLLTTYPGVKGIKTGFTDEAGYCLVTYLEYQGHKIIAVLLNSQNRRDEMKNLLDYSLKAQGVIPPMHQ